MKEIIFFIRAYDLGNKIHTIHAEWREKLSEKVIKMNREEMLGASHRVKIRPEKATVMQSRGLTA